MLRTAKPGFLPSSVRRFLFALRTGPELAVAASLILAACSTVAPTPSQQLATMCSPASPLAAADRDRLCATLASAHEPDLAIDWKKTGAPVYRALLLTPHQPIVSIRVETSPGGNAGTLTVRRLTDARLDLDRAVTLSEAETKAFAGRAEAASIWQQPLNSDAPTLVACKESSVLVAEAYAGNRYALSLSHCAAMRPLEEFVTGFYGLASARVPELTRGLETTVD